MNTTFCSKRLPALLLDELMDLQRQLEEAIKSKSVYNSMKNYLAMKAHIEDIKNSLLADIKYIKSAKQRPTTPPEQHIYRQTTR